MRNFSFHLRILKSLRQIYTDLFILDEHQPGILNRIFSTTVSSKTVWRIKSVLPAFVFFFLVPSLYLFSQNRTVTGTVIDESGAPVSGVSIILKGTSTGTSSDDAGKFTISAPSKGILVLSNVGFDNQEVPVRDQSEINVRLTASSESLNQVVVVGYGTQKKTSVTAAISTLKGRDVASTPVTNLSNTLGGRVAGVITRQNNGEPGNDASNIFIRGISSTGANQPLLIVDGIPRDFKQLDPNSIESFTVLKDAAAVAPYGVAGANGVILVTTKSGKTGAPTVTYNGYVGFQNPTVFPNYVSGYEYGVLQNAAAKNAGLRLSYSEFALQKLKEGSDPDASADPNVYRDVIKKNALLTNHNIEVSGGTEFIKFYASLGLSKPKRYVAIYK